MARYERDGGGNNFNHRDRDRNGGGEGGDGAGPFNRGRPLHRRKSDGLMFTGHY
jgi:hypothetical protein